MTRSTLKLVRLWLVQFYFRLRGWIKPPEPWVLVALIVSIISATFSGFNYFKSPKARAAIIVDHYDDNERTISIPSLGEKNMHNVRAWFVNNGPATADVHSVVIDPEFSPTPLTPDREAERMSYVAKNRAAIGEMVTGLQMVNGQKLFFSSHSWFPDQIWSDFTGQKQLLYVFGLITFSDEFSNGQEVTTEICVRLEPGMTWHYCASGHNVTIR